MHAKSVMTAFSIGLAAAGFLTGCDNTPTRPGSLSAQDPHGRVVTVLSMDVVGPQVVALGQPQQFRLVAQLNDGSSRDVTDQARWEPDNVFSRSMPGLVTGVHRT